MAKIFSVRNQLICQSQYCLNRAKTRSFTVLYVFVTNWGVKNEKSKIHGLPGVFENVDNGKKQKAKVKRFSKTAFIYHKFVLFTSK